MLRHTEEEVTIESPHPSTFEQARSQDDVIDLIDDSEMTTFEQLDSLQNNTSNNELHFPHTYLLKHQLNGWMNCHMT